MHAESAFKKNAVSKKGAIGLMQLMPATAERFGVRDAFNPEQNINGGTRYLSYLLKMFNNDIVLASAAYNAGENAVKKYNGVPPFPETQNYVSKVATLHRVYKYGY
jgi:soluble lytic murein transglycosylase-like protein